MKTQTFNLGFIGHKALQFQTLFNEFTPKANEYGYFLCFENITELVENKGVIVITNCFEDEKDFNDRLMVKLLSKI